MERHDKLSLSSVAAGPYRPAMSSQSEADIAALIEAFGSCAVANITDNLDRAVGAVGIRPFSKGTRLAGRARGGALAGPRAGGRPGR